MIFGWMAVINLTIYFFIKGEYLTIPLSPWIDSTIDWPISKNCFLITAAFLFYLGIIDAIKEAGKNKQD